MQICIRKEKVVLNRNSFEQSKITQKLDKGVKRPADEDIERAEKKLFKDHADADVMHEMAKKMVKNGGELSQAFSADNFEVDDIRDLVPEDERSEEDQDSETENTSKASAEEKKGKEKAGTHARITVASVLTHSKLILLKDRHTAVGLL